MEGLKVPTMALNSAYVVTQYTAVRRLRDYVGIDVTIKSAVGTQRGGRVSSGCQRI